MTLQGSLESGKQRQALFAQAGQGAANPSKRLCALKGAKTAGNLLLDLDPAHLSFGKMVVKRHAPIFQESPDGLPVFAQAITQMAGSTLFDSPPMAGWCSCTRMSWLRFVKQTQEARLPIGDLQGMQPVFALLPCLLGRLAHIQQQGFELGGPPPPLLFCQGGQFAQDMPMAGGVRTGIPARGFPAIMHA